MKRFEDKVVLIVGATSGIGAAAAALFAEEGAQVVVTGRREDKGQAVVDELISKGGKADYYKLDCSILEGCYKALDYVNDTYGRLDVLYYNSGVATVKSQDEGYFENSSVELWDYIMTVNLKNAYFMSLKAMPALKKTHGNIVITSSGASVDAPVSLSTVIYGISKAAVNHLVRLIALNVAPDGVRVNAIAPGITATSIIFQSSQEVVDQVTASVPMKKMATPEDQAQAVLFLASDVTAGSITGQVLLVDNGQFL